MIELNQVEGHTRGVSRGGWNFSLEDVEELSIPPTISTDSRDGIQGRDGKTVALTMSQRRQQGIRSVSSMSDTTSMAAEDLAASEVVDQKRASSVHEVMEREN